MEQEELEELVKRYIDAYNRRDVDDLLALMHDGAAYYDAFWTESCVGRDLRQYLHDTFEDDTYWYEQIGNVIATDAGVVFRYKVHERTDSAADGALFEGAEVLTVLDDKILTVSDFYCDPDEIDLVEVASLAALRHGVSSFANQGLSAKSKIRIQRRLAELMNEKKLYLGPGLTESKLADRIGCSVEHLFQAINIETRAEFRSFLDQYRNGHAEQQLPEAIVRRLHA